MADRWSKLVTSALPADGPIIIPPGRSQGGGEPACRSARTYLDAGARVIRVAGAEGVRECRKLPGNVPVWATLGPSANILPLQETTPQELEQHFAGQLEPLLESKPDAILIQSMHDLDEALVALRSARGLTRLKVGVSLVFGGGADLAETVMGQSCEEAARRLAEAGADLVGATCGVAMDEMVLIVRLMRDQTDLPILACPDAGGRELDGPEIVYREAPEDFASKSRSLAAAGANLIGGCCGVTPEHIRQTAAALGSEAA